MVDGSHGWVVGQYSEPNGSSAPAILHTTDGGQTWDGQNPGFASGVLLGLSAPDQNTAVACGVSGRDGVMLRTTDAGTTWTNVSVGTYDLGNAVAFADADHGWVSAADSQGFCMLATTDGGTTWRSQSCSSFPNF